MSESKPTKRKQWTVDEYHNTLVKQNGSCANPFGDCPCDGKLPAVKLDRDHIIPICLGGKEEPDNIQGLCQICHRKKTNNDLKLKTAEKNAKLEQLRTEIQINSILNIDNNLTTEEKWKKIIDDKQVIYTGNTNDFVTYEHLTKILNIYDINDSEKNFKKIHTINQLTRANLNFGTTKINCIRGIKLPITTIDTGLLSITNEITEILNNKIFIKPEFYQNEETEVIICSMPSIGLTKLQNIFKDIGKNVNINLLKPILISIGYKINITTGELINAIYIPEYIKIEETEKFLEYYNKNVAYNCEKIKETKQKKEDLRKMTPRAFALEALSNIIESSDNNEDILTLVSIHIKYLKYHAEYRAGIPRLGMCEFHNIICNKYGKPHGIKREVVGIRFIEDT